MKKRVQAIILMIAMVVSMFGAVAFDMTEAKAANEKVVKIHFLRADGNYTGYNAWIWFSGDGKAVDYSSTDAKGAIFEAKCDATEPTIGLIVKKGDGWEAKDVANDIKVDISEYISGTIDIYYTSGDEKVTVDGANAKKLEGAMIKKAEVSEDGKELICVMSDEVASVTPAEFTVKDSAGTAVAVSAAVADSTNKKAIRLTAAGLDRAKKYTITYNGLSMETANSSFFASLDFENKYTYDGNDLGATYTSAKTTFKVWAPTATAATVVTFKTGDAGMTDIDKTYPLTQGEKGTWSADVSEDLKDKYYAYKVTVDGKEILAGDPYAKGAATGEIGAVKSQVIDIASTNPSGWDKDTYKKLDKTTDASIYELHVRDFSSDPDCGIKNVGKYLAFTETGTKTAGGQITGIDYLKDLGIGYVHLLPTYDFGGINPQVNYNWGYNPVNYNVPEDTYGTDGTKCAQTINEYKQMVMSLHNNGIGVIADSVYNHVNNAGTYSFQRLVPGYFLRANSNSSGCGNDVASTRSMVRKFIVDSTLYWQSEYHVDGFRFDLMGILDVDTMNAIQEALRKVNPSTVVYGEGWHGFSAPVLNGEAAVLATKANCSQMNNIACFSDNLRDALKGGNQDTTTGFINGGGLKASEIALASKGQPDFATNPTNVINYSCCHDNLILWDKINYSLPTAAEADKIKMNNLAAAIVFTSQGIPFICSGEEFLKTKSAEKGLTPKKGFVENSYSSPDGVNMNDYSRATDYAQVYNYYKGLIEFRKNHSSLRLATKEDVEKYYKAMDGVDTATSKVVAFTLDKSEGEVADKIAVVYNPNAESTKVTLPAGEWQVCVNAEKAGTDVITKVTGEVEVTPLSCFVLVQGETKMKEAATTTSSESKGDKTFADASTYKEEESLFDSKTVTYVLVVAAAILALLSTIVYFTANRSKIKSFKKEVDVLENKENRLLKSIEEAEKNGGNPAPVPKVEPQTVQTPQMPQQMDMSAMNQMPNQQMGMPGMNQMPQQNGMSGMNQMPNQQMGMPGMTQMPGQQVMSGMTPIGQQPQGMPGMNQMPNQQMGMPGMTPIGQQPQGMPGMTQIPGQTDMNNQFPNNNQ